MESRKPLWFLKCFLGTRRKMQGECILVRDIWRARGVAFLSPPSFDTREIFLITFVENNNFAIGTI